MAASDLEGAVGRVRKELFQFVGVLGMADSVAEQDRAVFEVTGLPGAQEMVRGCESIHVAGVGGPRFLGGMAARSGPAQCRQKDR